MHIVARVPFVSRLRWIAIMGNYFFSSLQTLFLPIVRAQECLVVV
jgi:hypothetical protein